MYNIYVRDVFRKNILQRKIKCIEILAFSPTPNNKIISDCAVYLYLLQ